MGKHAHTPSIYTSGAFWTGAAERAVKTFAQALIAFLVAAETLQGVEWTHALGAATLAALISVLTSLADPQRASLTTTAGGANEEDSL